MELSMALTKSIQHWENILELTLNEKYKEIRMGAWTCSLCSKYLTPFNIEDSKICNQGYNRVTEAHLIPAE